MKAGPWKATIAPIQTTSESSSSVRRFCPPCSTAPETPHHDFRFCDRAADCKLAEEEAAELVNQSVQRFVDPADIAALALFLASDAARSISGQMIPIDGDA